MKTGGSRIPAVATLGGLSSDFADMGGVGRNTGAEPRARGEVSSCSEVGLRLASEPDSGRINFLQNQTHLFNISNFDTVPLLGQKVDF